MYDPEFDEDYNEGEQEQVFHPVLFGRTLSETVELMREAIRKEQTTQADSVGFPTSIT